jgi:hypothetical protein
VGKRRWESVLPNYSAASKLITVDETDNPASSTFITREPVLLERPENLSELVLGWLDECISDHKLCTSSKASSEIINDQYAELPTRVLEVSGSLETPSVKLIETHGLEGRYCALSHCWGTAKQRPLETNQKNINRYLDEIPFDQLPNNFRDAVRLVSGIGVRYLWIDSLCIIQDDLEDWKAESKVMGLVYQRAVLVIAAAGSTNCSEGLFVTDRPAPITLRIPYNSAGVSHGSFNVALIPEGDKAPGYGPLRERAWAFQEWHLARRAVFFMPGGLTWRCNGHTLDENGVPAKLQLHDHLSWIEFLTDYTYMNLTGASDRLIAIQGIASEMQKTRTDRFLFGVWEDRLVEQLLWRPKYGEGERLGLPSWCWASIESLKEWLPEIPANTKEDRVLQEVPRCIQIADSGSLVVSGDLIRPACDTKEIPHCCVVNLPGYGEALRQEEHITISFEVKLFLSYVADGNTTYLVSDQHNPKEVFGYVMFDQNKVVPGVFWFPLASIARHTCDPMKLEKLTDTNTSYPKNGVLISEEHRDFDVSMSNEKTNAPGTEGSEPHRSESELEECTGPDCVELLKTGRSDHVYWALMLEQVDGEAKFKRVGMAMLYPRAMDVEKEKLTGFEIV